MFFLIVHSCTTASETPDYQIQTKLIFEAVADATKKLDERISILETELALQKSSPKSKNDIRDKEFEDVERKTPTCQEGTVSMWDDAKKEFYCLSN